VESVEHVNGQQECFYKRPKANEAEGTKKHGKVDQGVQVVWVQCVKTEVFWIKVVEQVVHRGDH